MDFRYLKYIGNKSYYYTYPKEKNQESLLRIENIPDKYIVIDGTHWINILYKKQDLPKQGWKIHISSALASAQETLDIVSSLMIDRNISFKYVRSLYELGLKDSKYGDRGSSGKFITIYPSNIPQFIEILKLLEESLSALPKGPYILNDKRWFNSNVYFRYGSFMERYYYKGGQKIYAIENLDGELVEDLRTPYYSLPDFVDEPTEIKEMDMLMDSEISPSPSLLDTLEIKDALHFSNGGGVYLAVDKENNEVVLKEGRPNTGLDAQNKDAFSRVINEGNALDKLSEAKYPVKKIDAFKVWEHSFILEEYIEGEDLSAWMVHNYPFTSSKNNESYTKSCVNILTQLIEAVEEIHSFNVGMGDLSPSNIVVNEKEEVRLIDFETASTIDDVHPGLMTPGYVGDLSMNREQSDWFALLRIARQLFVPIGTVQDISWNIDNIHNCWIEETFGTEAIDIVQKIQSISDQHDARPMEELISTNGQYYEEFDLKTMINKLRNGIFKDLSSNEILLPGDIRQFEMENGNLNVLTGGFGVAMALHKTGGINDTVVKWIENQKISDLIGLENGLYTGKAGIATVLWQLGYKQESMELFDSITEFEDLKDVSLATGLSGIGLAFLGLDYELESERYLNNCLKIADILERRLYEDAPIIPFDEGIVDKGIFTSWSGVSLFFSALYKKTKNTKWLSLAQKTLEKDLSLGLFDEDGVYHVDDDFRILPYLAGGSAGLAIAIIELQINSRTNTWTKEIEGISKIAKSKTFYNCGLFHGTAGIVASSNLIDLYKDSNDLTKSALKTLNLYLLEKDNYLYVPGDSCFRVSGDLLSGSSGLLLVLQDILDSKNYSWLPILNLEKVLESTKALEALNI
ncbi:class III lanthionine synthetase LanKC [Bacillus toyonensis]|uniref:class III lanthionine synthetase LanKC n=1 Tax=Bacillus toyonensis TaxID=155322 RepID=UPI002E2322A1|nr:class III lanthionine synthetase LanKC [Bacillus toyonensis]